MLNLQDDQRGIIFTHYDEYGWCIRGWNRHTGGKNAGCKRKSKIFTIDESTLIILKNIMQEIINNKLDENYMITIRKNEITLYIKPHELALKIIENGKSRQKYKVELNEDRVKSIISQLNKIKDVKEGV